MSSASVSKRERLNGRTTASCPARVQVGDVVRSKSPGGRVFLVVRVVTHRDGGQTLYGRDGIGYDGHWYRVVPR